MSESCIGRGLTGTPIPPSLSHSLVASDAETLAQLALVAEAISQYPQTDLQTSHLLHGGQYHRTCRMPAGTVIVGAVVRVPTSLIIAGDVSLWTGRSWQRMTGYHVLSGEIGRQACIFSHAETFLTMTAVTEACTIEAAEAEMTEHPEQLLSRRQL